MPIKVNNVTYKYSIKTPFEKAALYGVSLEIPDHAFTAIVGHTGSGKSTLVQLMNGLLTPYSGEVVVDDFVVTSKKNKRLKDLRKHVGLVFQFPEYQLFEETVEKDVAFGLKNYGVKEEEALAKAREVLLSVGIPEKYFTRSPFELSGGERRRVAIAGILVLNPNVLVLDEPTAGLDAQGTKEIMSLLNKMHNEGKSIILVTHDMDILLQYCKQVIVLKEGSLVFDGKPIDLFNLDLQEFSLKTPRLYKLALMLKNNGAPIDLESIHSSDDLADQIARWKKKDE